MKLDLIFPVLPPTIDGIGAHTARLSSALAVDHTVRVLTTQEEYDTIPNTNVLQAFSRESRRGVYELTAAVRQENPDWFILQFNQFSYGRWGLNPYVPATLYHIRRTCRDTRVAVIFHEDFVPVNGWKNAVMTSWQRAQFWALGRLADTVFFSIEPWAERYRSWFPHTPVHHLPVGSNMPYDPVDPADARRQLDISDESVVAGLFGTARASRILSFAREAAGTLSRRADNFVLLYVGPDGGAVRRATSGIPLVDTGPLPPRKVSHAFAAMDIYLAPFIDGVSTRRGSFMTALQHGIPSVTTIGHLTDTCLKAADEEAFLAASPDDADAFARQALSLTKDSARRSRIGARGRELYESSFSWDRISSKLTDALEAAPSREPLPRNEHE